MFSQAQRTRRVTPRSGRAASNASSGPTATSETSGRWTCGLSHHRQSGSCWRTKSITSLDPPCIQVANPLTASWRTATTQLFAQRLEPAVPGRLAGEEEGAEALGHVGEPPGLGAVRVLQGDERDLAPVAAQERLGVGEVGVAEVERADRRVTAALERVVEVDPHQFLVLAELPDEPPAGRLRAEPAAASRNSGQETTPWFASDGPKSPPAGAMMSLVWLYVPRPGTWTQVPYSSFATKNRTGTPWLSAIAWARAIHPGRAFFAPQRWIRKPPGQVDGLARAPLAVRLDLDR